MTSYKVSVEITTSIMAAELNSSGHSDERAASYMRIEGKASYPEFRVHLYLRQEGTAIECLNPSKP